LLAVWLALAGVLGLGSPDRAWAASPIDAWRTEAGQTRILAENAPPLAYKEAQRLQASLPADATAADRVRVLNLLARIEIYLALTQAAAEHADLALAQASQNGDRVGQAEAQLNVTLNAINQAKIDESMAATTRSMELLEGVNRPDLLGEALLRMSMMYRRQGDQDNSVTMAMQAMEIAKRSKDPLALAYAHQGLAVSFDQSYRYQEAGKQYMRMREQARAIPSKWLEAHAIRGLANVSLELGDAVGAERLMREAVAMLRVLQVPFTLNYGLFGLADVVRTQGRHGEALKILDEVIAIYERYPSKIGLWWSLQARSEDHQALGKLPAARADAQRAYALAREIKVPLYLSESVKRLAAIAAAAGDHHQAYQLGVEAAGMADQAARERANTRMVELAQRYETDSKQREINELTRRNVQQTAELQKRMLQQRLLWTVLGGGALVLAGTAYFVLRLRRSNRLLEALNMQVQRSQNQLQATLDAVPDPLFVLGLDGRYHDFHSPRTDLLVVPTDVLIGKTVSDILPPDAADICMAALREAHEQGVSTGKQCELSLSQGKFWFELSVSRKPTDIGQEPRFIVLARDITERKQQEIQEETRRLIFERLAQGGELAEILGLTVRYIEQLHPNFLVSIMLVDEAGKHLLAAVAPRLPEDYTAAINGIEIGEGFGSCGTAAWRGKTVIAEDLGTHPFWVPCRHLTSQAGLRSCWSEPIFDSDGKVLGTFCIYRREPGLPSEEEMNLVRRASHLAAIAIERKRIEEALRESERQFRTLAENAPDNICRYDLQCRHVYLNQRLEATLGVPAVSLLGKTPLEARPNVPQIAEYQARIAAVIETGKPGEIEITLPDIGEGVRDHNVRFVAERGTQGEIVGVLAIGRDITERRRTEEALREREQRYRGIFDNVLDTLYLLEVTPEGRFRNLEVNPAFEKSSGLSSADLVGKFIEETVPQEVAQIVIARYHRCIEAGTAIDEEVSLAMPSGLRHYHSTLIPVRDDSGRIHRIVGISRDITERKGMEHDLKESQHLLRQLAARNETVREDERKHLTREIHDELGQYLLALRLGVSVVGLEFGATNASLHEKTQRLIEMVDTTIKVVRNVVASLRPTALDMGIVSALEWLAGEYVERAGIHCELHISEEDLDLDDACATAIFRIVQESLTNIVRHAQADKVAITLERSETNCFLEVRDNGRGFDPSLRKEKSFGLVSIRERALMLGGEVEISSAPGRSTVIRVHIPLHNAVTNALSES
jgi:PAS domain S-box-containing protein